MSALTNQSSRSHAEGGLRVGRCLYWIIVHFHRARGASCRARRSPRRIGARPDLAALARGARLNGGASAAIPPDVSPERNGTDDGVPQWCVSKPFDRGASGYKFRAIRNSKPRRGVASYEYHASLQPTRAGKHDGGARATTPLTSVVSPPEIADPAHAPNRCCPRSARARRRIGTISNRFVRGDPPRAIRPRCQR